MTENLLLPPFGRILLAYQEQKVRLDFSIYIHVGKEAKECAFADIKAGSIATFLPYGDNFTRYRWPILNQYAIVCDQGGVKEGELHKFCLYLLGFKPRIVYLWSSQGCQFFKGAKL